MDFRLTFGSDERHEVAVTYTKALRLLRVTIDGRTVWRHCGLLPWAQRRAHEFKTDGAEAHTLVFEPPGSAVQQPSEPARYRIWLDGSPILRVMA